MALKFFIFCIIFSPFLLTDNNNVVDEIKTKSDILVAKVSFLNSVLYDINTKNVDKIVDAKEAYIYEKKDALYDVRVILRNANNNSDTISAKYMKKENELYNFQNNVILKRDKDLELKTESLQYDIKNGIATNDVDFILRYRNSFFSGKNLYLSKNDYVINGDNVHFRINSKDL